MDALDIVAWIDYSFPSLVPLDMEKNIDSSFVVVEFEQPQFICEIFSIVFYSSFIFVQELKSLLEFIGEHLVSLKLVTSFQQMNLY